MTAAKVMIALFIAFAILAGLFYESADKPGDNFGAVVPVFLFGFLAVLDLVALVIYGLYRAVT